MKIQVTQTTIKEVDESIYKEWLEEGESGKDWDDMTDTEKLEVIKDCEDESGYEIVQEISDWKTTIVLTS